MRYLAFVYVVLATGCILPVSTGAPLPATTVGKGNVGVAISGEAPTLDLIADRDNKSAGTNDAIAYGAAPAAASTVTVSYGVAEDTDVEIAGEGALYFFIIPIPTGGSIGLRQHFAAGDTFDVGVAARVGRVSSSASVTDSSGNSTESSAHANYGAFQGIIQTKRGFVRPLVALNLMPAHIRRDPSDADPFWFHGFASSITLALNLTGKHAVFGPYITATNFYSDKFDNSGWFVSGGLMLAFRPDRNREQIVIPPAPPAGYPPPGGPYPPPNGGPYPPPAGPAPAPAPPPPQPTTSPM